MTCLFCRIASREERAAVVLDDEACFGFLDHRPLFTGHVLLVPKAHVETLDDAYCSDLRRTAIGPFRVEDAGEELAIARIGELIPAAGEALR